MKKILIISLVCFLTSCGLIDEVIPSTPVTRKASPAPARSSDPGINPHVGFGY